MSAGGLFNGTGDRSVSRRGYGGPQADCFDERELSRINRKLKKKVYIHR